jgi:Domain of unknown function (DUF4277)
LTHGQVICALGADRLTSRTPLWQVEDWARAWAVEEVFATLPQALNDDRIGRALDAEEPEEGFIAPGSPIPRTAGSTASSSKPALGSPVRAACPSSTAPMTAAPARSPRWPGRCGRCASSPGRAASFWVDFIAPASKTYVPTAALAALDVQAAAPVDYLAERDQGKPPEQRGSYRVVEDTMTITGRRTTDPVLRLRRVLVWSSARAGAAATSRARKLDRAREDLHRLTRGLGSRHYPTVDKVQARLAAIAKAHRVTGLLHAVVGSDPATGKPTLAWWFDPAALAAEAPPTAGMRC